MRSGLTELQTNILNASVKNRFFLFEVTLSGSVTPDYYWSDQEKSFNGQAYTFKIMKDGFSPITLNMGSPESKVIPPCEISVQVSFPNSIIDGLYASDFEGASVTIRLVCGTDLKITAAPRDEDEATAEYDYQETEIMSWRFKVLSSSAVDQVMIWECQDFFTLQLEGDYPNTPLASDLFRADIMKSDNVCVPLAFGTPFFPVRWISKRTTATFVDLDTFTISGDQTSLFSAGQFLLASCGVDGGKSCWVTSSSYAVGVTTVNLTAASDDLTSNLTVVQTDHYLLGESGVTYTIDRARTPTEQSGKSTYLPASYTFKQDTVTGSDASSYRVVQILCNDANKDGTNDANGFWGIIGKEIYDMPCRFSRSDLAAITDPALIAEYIFEDWGIPSAEIDDVSKAAATAIFTARGFSLAIGLWYRQQREKLISRLFSVSGMIPIYRDKIGFKVLTKVPQLIIEEDLIEPGSFSTSRLGYTKAQSDSGYVTWQIATEPVDTVNKSLVACKSTTTKPSESVIECDWVQDAVKAQKAGKLALQRSLLRDKSISFRAQGKILVLEPGDMITINPANFGAEGAAYDCLINKMTIHEGLWVDVECIRFSDALDDWDDLSASDIVVNDANIDNAHTPIYQGPKDANGIAGTPANVITKTVYVGAEAGITVTDGNNIKIEGGGDLYLDGSDTNPAIISIVGTSYSVQIGGNAAGDSFLIRPTVDGAVDLHLGYDQSWWGTENTKFETIYGQANTLIDFASGGFVGAVDGASIRIGADTTPLVTFTIHTNSPDSTHYYHFEYGSIYPGHHMVQNCGTNGNAWDNVYSDDYQNVADFPYLDNRLDKDGKIILVDDIEVISAIKSSGIFNPVTGLEIIDDNTLPEWLLSKCKSGEIARTPDGKPYLSLRTMISLLMGAIRQLDEKKKDKE